jgi:hypothetical protein
LNRLLILSTFVLGLGASTTTSAQEPASADNLILVTIDGLRFQELFSGADQRLIKKDPGGVEDAKATKAKYWDEDAIVRREKLMPFFWNFVAKNGQVFGSPDHDSIER